MNRPERLDGTRATGDDSAPDPRRAAAEPPSPPKRLLLVESDPSLAAHWASSLGERGWEVTSAGTAREALESSESPEVLVCDSELPETSGLRLARDLRRLSPELRVLLIAASMPPDVPEDVRVILKPFSADRLASVVEGLPAARKLPDRGPGSPASAPWILRLAAVLVAVLLALGTWWGLREEPLPEPGRSGVVRGDELRALEPRGPVDEVHELRWTPSEGAARYVVWVRRLDDSVVWQTSSAGERVDARDAGLEPGIPYRWEIEAFDGSGRRIALSESTDFRLDARAR